MKSITFTLFKDKLFSGEKQRTFRVLFIPTYEVGEIVNITFKTDGVKEILFQAKILDIYPRQIIAVTFNEAQLDGFYSVEEFREGIMKINRIKDVNRWGFFTVFKRVD